MAGKVENGEPPTHLRERLEIRLDENLNDPFTGGVDLDTDCRVTKVYRMAASVLSPNNGVRD